MVHYPILPPHQFTIVMLSCYDTTISAWILLTSFWIIKFNQHHYIILLDVFSICILFTYFLDFPLSFNTILVLSKSSFNEHLSHWPIFSCLCFSNFYFLVTLQTFIFQVIKLQSLSVMSTANTSYAPLLAAYKNSLKINDKMSSSDSASSSGNSASTSASVLPKLTLMGQVSKLKYVYNIYIIDIIKLPCIM